MDISDPGPVAEIDLAALSDNARHLASLAPAATFAPVVKANAYGLGDQAVVEALSTRMGARTYFTAYANEAAPLAEAFPQHTFYILNGFLPAENRHYDAGDLRPVLNTAAQAKAWQRTHDGKKPAGLAIDIGMNRLGFRLEDAVALAQTATISAQSIRLVVMHLSHGSTPGAPENAAALTRYGEAREALTPLYPQAAFSLSASAALFLEDGAEEALIRPGIALYGGAPDGDPGHALKPVVTLTAPLIAIRTVEPGETVGYNGRWRATDRTQIGILGIGYADGYPRSLTNRGHVMLGDKECPVLGAISMDLTAIDLTNAHDAQEGDRAELFGPKRLIDAVAADAGTIAYELLTSMGPRVQRIYRG